MSLPRVTLACAVIALSCGLLAGDLMASPKERLRQKRAQAALVLAQVSALDRRFEASVEAWNGARYELGLTRTQLRQEKATLRLAERERRHAVARVRRRLVALYETGDNQTTIEILFGSTTLSDLLDRLEAARAVASADHELAVNATAARNRYAGSVRKTVQLEHAQAETLSRRNAERKQIGALLVQRKRLLASVEAEVVKLRAEEARRQAALAALARARLERQQELLRRQAAERARAAAAAAAAAKSAAAQPAPASDPTTPAPPASDPSTAPTTTTGQDPATPTTAPTPTAPTAPTALPEGHPDAASIAMKYLGVPYVWGGSSPAGFDCSGLVMYVYAQLGVSLPHYAAGQFGYGTPVPRDQLQPGDLVFFDGLDHVGIYIGGGQMVHAPQTGDVVKITPLSEFGDRYVGARRI
jgi:cell wall-associated NlpC family hydrolase